MDEPIRVAVLAGAGDPIADLEPGGLPGFLLTPLAPARLLTARPRPHVVHLGDPRPVATRAARAAGVPIVAAGTDLAAAGTDLAAGALRTAAVVLSPDADADRALEAGGVSTSRLVRCDSSPATGPVTIHPGPLGITAAGDERALIAHALRLVQYRDPRLGLVLEPPGGATLLVCDALVPERPIRDAQAAGVPVVAVDGPSARRLIDSGRSGCIVPQHADALADAIGALARRPALRARLSAGGRLAVRERWLRGLADGYALAFGRTQPAISHARAA